SLKQNAIAPYIRTRCANSSFLKYPIDNMIAPNRLHVIRHLLVVKKMEAERRIGITAVSENLGVPSIEPRSSPSLINLVRNKSGLCRSGRIEPTDVDQLHGFRLAVDHQ